METGIDSVKKASKKVVYKIAEILGNQIADAVIDSYDDKITKIKPVIDEYSKKYWKRIIPREKEEILNELRYVI